MDDLTGYLDSRREMVDRTIDGYLPSATREPRAIHECMRYSASGGKRLRPLIALAVADMLGCPTGPVLPTCAALEFIHTHSLILDDLPCMDDDDYRRGRSAAHRAFGEGVALLAADALLNLAIALLGSNHRLAGVSPEVALEIIREVGESVGTDGVIGGQLEDLTFSSTAGGAAVLERIHLGKTARLFSLSARAGAFIAGATARQVDAVGLYAEKLGLAFQIVDDILDEGDGGPEGDGKRPSYAVAWGSGPAHALAARATSAALEALEAFGPEADRLRQLAQYNLSRTS